MSAGDGEYRCHYKRLTLQLPGGGQQGEEVKAWRYEGSVVGWEARRMIKSLGYKAGSWMSLLHSSPKRDSCSRWQVGATSISMHMSPLPEGRSRQTCRLVKLLLFGAR